MNKSKLHRRLGMVVLMAATSCAFRQESAAVLMRAAEEFSANKPVAIGSFATVTAPRMKRMADGSLFFFGDAGAKAVIVSLQDPGESADVDESSLRGISSLPAQLVASEVEVGRSGKPDWLVMTMDGAAVVGKGDASPHVEIVAHLAAR